MQRLFVNNTLSGQTGVFTDRAHAGRVLAEMLRPQLAGIKEAVVLAIPAGGVPVGLALAGALGNSIDRIGRGYVIDYLDIGPGLWPVFNLADASVVVGVALVFLLGLFGRKK